LAFLVTNIRAKSPAAGIKAETVSTLIVKPEAFMQRFIFLTRQTAISIEGRFWFIVKPSGCKFGPPLLYFLAGLEDSW
jgi:hypothetical protein